MICIRISDLCVIKVKCLQNNVLWCDCICIQFFRIVILWLIFVGFILIFWFTSIPRWFLFIWTCYGGWARTRHNVVPDRAAVILMSLRRNYTGLFSSLLLPLVIDRCILNLMSFSRRISWNFCTVIMVYWVMVTQQNAALCCMHRLSTMLLLHLLLGRLQASSQMIPLKCIWLPLKVWKLTLAWSYTSKLKPPSSRNKFMRP